MRWIDRSAVLIVHAKGRPEADPYRRTVDHRFVGGGLPDAPQVRLPLFPISISRMEEFPLYILLAILIFGFLIFIHELGHFICAKLSGVQVNEFALCMGPAIFQKTWGETTYSLRLIPIGGYCAMEGEDEESDNPRAFTRVKAWKKLIILAAGSFMNFLTGVVLVLILLSSAEGFVEPVIADFYDGAAIESEEGLHQGDEIYKIDGERVWIYSDVSLLLSRNTTGVFDLEVIRDGEKVVLNDFVMEKQEFIIDGRPQMLYGMQFTAAEKSFPLLMKNVWGNSMYFVQMVKIGLQDLVSGAVGLQDMSGPVGIVRVIHDTGTSAETTRDGVMNVLYLAAFIAINLAVMNLLPLPALDGGRIACLLLTLVIEAVTRRKLDPKYEGYIHSTGMVLLMGLMVFVTFHDVFMIFMG